MLAGTAWKRSKSRSEDPYRSSASAIDDVESAQHLRRVGDVRRQVEDRVEVELEARLRLQQLPQRRAAVPCLLGQPLDDAVGVVARAAALHQRQQHPLREERAVRELEGRPPP